MILLQILSFAFLGASVDSSISSPSPAGVVLRADFHATVGFHPASAGTEGDLGFAENYMPDWDAHRLDPELVQRWEALPSLAQVDLSATMDSVKIFASLPLRRDIDAWRRDPTGGNLLHGVEELDINAPYEGWISWRSQRGVSLQVGRFRQSFSPSPYGVILGSNLIHDGAVVRVPMGRWTFDWFFSSLNPWLMGVNTFQEVAPGSETVLQTTRTISNQRGRIYDAPSKSLFLHRLSCEVGNWELSIVEQLLVGGKAPQWRDAVPFVVWHNSFGDGYSKVSTALQATWSPPHAGRFHAQGIIEDIKMSVGELEENDDPRTVYASNLGWSGATRQLGGVWSASVDASLTSATFNNHMIPLLKGTSRRLYRSNNRLQGKPDFVDTWIVDQPLGYLRGSDAADLWTHLDWTSPDALKGAGLELDWLNQGDAAVWMDEAQLPRRKGPLSGEVTSQWRALAHGWGMVARRIRMDAGLGIVRTDAPAATGRRVLVTPDLSGSLSIVF